MYAVVTTGGKQYRVEAGNELTIERIPGDAGSSITFDRVLLVGDGDTITVGTPTVSGATVSATMLGEALGPKLAVFKFKQKVKYRRMAGHRQHLVRVRIDEISASGKTVRAEEPAAATETPKPSRTRAAQADAAPAPTDEKPKRARRTTATKAADAAAPDDAEPKPKRTRRAKKADDAGETDSTAKAEE
jgi:large subunit ribosomal protein L21